MPRGPVARARLAVAAAVLRVSAAAAADGDDIGWDLLATSSGAEVQRTCFGIPALPSWAFGSFFISGPARFEKGGYRFRSLFDGYGRINRLEIRDGEACYTSKWMNTNYFREAEKLGRICNGLSFYGTEPKLPPCPWEHPFCALTGAQMDNNWVWMIPVGGEGLMTTDSPVFVRLDLDSLNTSGAYPWHDSPKAPEVPPWMLPFHAPATGSTHAVLRPGTDATWVEILLEAPMTPLNKPYLGIYSFDGNVPRGLAVRKQLAQVPLKHLHYFHSFGVSEHYVVLPCNMGMGVPASGHLLDAFRDVWDGIKVVDLEGNVQAFETEKFFHVHIANTFENATGIVMDLGAYREIPFAASPVLIVDQFKNKTARDSLSNRAEVWRLHMHLAGPLRGQVTKETFQVPGRTSDFYKINPAMNGRPYCFYYATEWFHDGRAYASMAILKHDLCRDTRTYWSKPHAYPGEPFFIDKPGSGAGADVPEDEGLLVFISLDGRRGASDFVILDAATFEELVVVKLPVHVPFTAHGQFVPAAARAIGASRGGGSDPARPADLVAAVEAAVLV